MSDINNQGISMSQQAQTWGRALLRSFIIKQMKTITAKRQNNITLRQYLINSSLKKRVTSRTNSKETKKSSTQQTKKSIELASIQKLGRDTLIEQIKLFLAENIQEMSKLNLILKMFDNLISLFYSELHDKNREFGLLQTMMHQQQMLNRWQFNGEKLMNKKVYTEPQEIIKQQMAQKRERKNSIIEVYNYVQDSKSSNNQSIPNINVLLQTRTLCKETQTQETLNGKESFLNQSKISIQFDYDYLQPNSLSTSRNSKFGNNAKKSRTNEFQSLNNSFKLSSQGNALSKFEQFKRRVVK